MTEKKATTKRIASMVFLAISCLAIPALAQQSETVIKGPSVIKEFRHDTGPLLREIAPLLPEYSLPSEHEIENHLNPNHPWRNTFDKDPVLQTAESSPTLQTPSFGLEFDGLGVGDQFFCNCMPPDNDGAAGTTQYVQYINLSWAVWDKSGNMVLGPLAGSSFWSGFGGSCQTDNSGDTIVRFDAAAQRWVVAQFAINGSAPDYECVAVSTTADATGSYNRYAFPFNNFPDYPKLGVWPDAYYFTFNNFNIAGSAYVAANVCAADRTAMLAGSAATMQCFLQTSSDFGMLPSDLDGATPPAAGTPNFIMELDPSGGANLDMFKFHVDFTTPANSTFTGPTQIPVAAFTPLCPVSGNCVKQPNLGSDLLEGLGDRLMYRLVYRNFDDHTTLLVSHSIVVALSGGVRWYEIHNPETSPTVFQSGTYAPDTRYRWMPSIAMDQNQNLAIGFSRSSSTAGDYPSLVYAGRTPSDPAGTLESEVVLKAGAGSQTSFAKRWGDYTSLTVDPTDDCTFWFTEEYEKTNGGFNWSTAIGTFVFPGCGGGVTPDFSLNAVPSSLTVAQGSTSGPSTITVVPINGFSGSVTLSASGLPSGVTAGFTTNPTTSTSTLTFTASATAATGTVSVTIQGVSGALNHTAQVSLTVNPSPTPDFSLTAVPGSLSVTQGSTSGPSTITVVPVNGFTGSVTLSASGLPTGVTAGFTTNPTTSTSTLTFTASATAATGTVSVTIQGASGGLNHTTQVSLTVNPSPTPDFSLTAVPNALAVTQGSTSGPSTITVVPVNGFTGSVTLSASGLPSGVTAGFTTNPTTSTSMLTFTASATAATGTTSVTIQGVSGALNHSTQVSLTVNSSGGSPVVSLSPTSLTWSQVVVGVTSAAKMVTVTNTGTATLNISNIAISGDFTQQIVARSCGSTLVAGNNCLIKVVFTPTQVGPRTGSITITDNAADSPQSVSLSGTGAPQATLTPVTATYASQTVGTTSTPRVFTLSNKLSVALSGISISTTGDFSQSATTCTTSLAANSTCTISVVFTPTQKGTRTGSLSVSDSAINSPETSSLKGTGK